LTDDPEVPFAANAVRLSPREWVVALILIAVILIRVPAVWERAEPLHLEANHRMPFRLGNDYWLYDRTCRAACGWDTTLVVGDSVVWGHYVTKDETLSAHLNRLTGEGRFANLGIDGIHPAALAGLMADYGKGISGSDVILHANLLWMSSKRHDLQETKEFAFNHPKLVPQFSPRIPCYRASVADRLAIVVGRKLPFCDWASHMQVAYFDNRDLHTWTVEHPHANPARAVTLKLPSPDEPPSPKPDARPWAEKGIRKFNPPWVEPDGPALLSVEEVGQWPSFCEKLSAPSAAVSPAAGIGALLPPGVRMTAGEIAKEGDSEATLRKVVLSLADTLESELRRTSSQHGPELKPELKEEAMLCLTALRRLAVDIAWWDVLGSGKDPGTVRFWLELPETMSRVITRLEERARDEKLWSQMRACLGALREIALRGLRRLQVVQAINQALRSEDFSLRPELSQGRVSARGARILRIERGARSQTQRLRLNRLLLEAAFPGELAKSEEKASFQWRCFKRTVESLRSRGNRTFVLLGPFNEHMLTPESVETYNRVKGEAEDWLQEENIPYLIAPALPSELYADASHPLAEGYKLLAKQLFDSDAFTRFDRSKP